MNIKTVLPVIPNWPREGVDFIDVCGLLTTPVEYRETIDWIVDQCRNNRFKPTSIVAIESRGFVFGAPVALELGLPLVLTRKPGKLPGPVHRIDYDTEYSSDSLTIQQGAPVGSTPFIVDDVLATGGTIAAVNQLLLTNFDVDRVSAVVPIALLFLPGVAKCLDNDINLMYHTSYE